MENKTTGKGGLLYRPIDLPEIEMQFCAHRCYSLPYVGPSEGLGCSGWFTATALPSTQSGCCGDVSGTAEEGGSLQVCMYKTTF